MIARLRGSSNALEPEALAADCPRVSYRTARQNSDPFPDRALLDPVDEDQHDEVRSAAYAMVAAAVQNSLGEENTKELQDSVDAYIKIFRTSLSSGPPAQFKPMEITVRPDVTPVRVRLRKYFQDQRGFLDRFVSELVGNGMRYPNPAFP